MVLAACLGMALGASAARLGDVKSTERVQNAATTDFSQSVSGFATGIRADSSSPELQSAKGDSAPTGYEMLAAKKNPKKKK